MINCDNLIVNDQNYLGKIKLGQLIKVTCDECLTVFERKYKQRMELFEKHNCDLCRSCLLRKQYLNGTRESIFSSLNKENTGLSYNERYGAERAKKIKAKLKENSAGEKNPMYGRFTDTQRDALYKWTTGRKGQSNKEFYGEDKAAEISKKLSLKSSGENNPMYGKPSPKGSGHSISGWYKTFYFRSLLELAFIFEHENEDIRSAENIAIQYVDENTHKRTYHPDFIIGNCIYEIKAEWAKSLDNNVRKFLAASEFCQKNNYIFNVKTENDIMPLLKEKLKQKYDEGYLKFHIDIMDVLRRIKW